MQQKETGMRSFYRLCILIFLAVLGGCRDGSVPETLLVPALPSANASAEGRNVTLTAAFPDGFGTSRLSAFGFYFGEDEASMERMEVAETDGSEYSLTLSGLEFSRDYHFCAWVSNGRDELRSAVMTVRTGDKPAGEIKFKDLTVKKICIENWDFDADGVFTLEEAEMVRSLGFAFKRNDDITSFDELEHFTGLRAIPDSAFLSCRNLTSVKLPEGVTSIRNFAFTDCRELKEAALPEGLESIGDNALNACPKLDFEKLPDGLKSIGAFGIANCGSLSLTSLPETLTSIGNAAFAGDVELALKELPPHLTSIGDGTFDGCYKLCISKIPEGIVSIGKIAFGTNRSLTQLTLPSSLLSIGKAAFSDCNSLSVITSLAATPPSVESSMIGEYAHTIYVPASALSAYISAPGWSAWAEKFVGIPE